MTNGNALLSRVARVRTGVTNKLRSPDMTQKWLHNDERRGYTGDCEGKVGPCKPHPTSKHSSVYTN